MRSSGAILASALSSLFGPEDMNPILTSKAILRESSWRLISAATAAAASGGQVRPFAGAAAAAGAASLGRPSSSSGSNCMNHSCRRFPTKFTSSCSSSSSCGGGSSRLLFGKQQQHQQSRAFSAPGFSFPGPRKLDEITNLAKLKEESPSDVEKIWKAYHNERDDTLGEVMLADKIAVLKERREECPLFILPVFRGDGYFTLVSQWQGTHNLITFLDDFRNAPETAQPFITVSTYEDLVQDKGLALIRADVGHNLNKAEGAHLMELLMRYYLEDERYAHVKAFNCSPDSFDFEGYLKGFPRPHAAPEIVTDSKDQ